MDFTFEDSYPADQADKIPVEFRPLYAERDGKLVLETEKFSGIRSAVTGLNKALKASRTEAKTYKSRAESVDLGKLSEFGETPDGILEAFQAKIAEAQATGDQDLQRRLEKTRNELLTQHRVELEKRDASTKSYRQQLEDTLGRQVALQALSGKAVDPELALPFILQSLRPVEKDGRIQMIVVDAEGDPRVNPVTQLPFTIADLVEEMRGSDKYAPIFRSDAPRGGGSRQTPDARKVADRNTDSRAQLSSIDKIRIGLNKGQASSRAREAALERRNGGSR